MKIAMLFLVLLPPMLLLIAWIKMQLQVLSPKREPTEDELKIMLTASVIYTRTFLLAFQETQDKKEHSKLVKEYVEGMNEISRMV